MILTAHQPSYLPWLGLFHKISLVDEFCVFDQVQYVRGGFDNRNMVKTAQGPIWLTVPVESSGHFDKACSEIRIVQNGWARKHVRTIEQAYRRAPYFDTYMGPLEEILSTEFELLADLNFALLGLGIAAFDLAPVIRHAGDYSLTGSKSDLVLSLCRTLGATEYIFGGEGRNYADIEAFRRAGVRPKFLAYASPEYRQLHGPYVPNMAFIDLLFNEGPTSGLLVRNGSAVTLD